MKTKQINTTKETTMTNKIEINKENIVEGFEMPEVTQTTLNLLREAQLKQIRKTRKIISRKPLIRELQVIFIEDNKYEEEETNE